jgi:hemolysin III
VIAAKPVLAHVPLATLLWLVAGGLLYSMGVVFYVWKRLPYSHAVWHVFVLGGSICHYFAVLRSVLGNPV